MVYSKVQLSAQSYQVGQWLGEFAASMGKSSKLATIEEIERLWYSSTEMTESSKVSKFSAEVIKLGGEGTQEVIRIGSFNLISEGEYVAYDIENQVIELPKQPEARFVDSAGELADASSGFVRSHWIRLADSY